MSSKSERQRSGRDVEIVDAAAETPSRAAEAARAAKAEHGQREPLVPRGGDNDELPTTFDAEPPGDLSAGVRDEGSTHRPAESPSGSHGGSSQ